MPAASLIQKRNNQNENALNDDRAKPQHRKYGGLKQGGGYVPAVNSC